MCESPQADCGDRENACLDRTTRLRLRLHCAKVMHRLRRPFQSTYMNADKRALRGRDLCSACLVLFECHTDLETHPCWFCAVDMSML